ncbi:MAG: winged helix-turn-helix transcriptional regulator [Saprospiraceae bacterium]|jgi:DNA-binding transcriptional ArsR family regulator|nr:winged helix-turn-helix transcriptional regulator [Saprospiraceae bacterium]MBK7372138.1 winged helix-turn-helix transcriptional regulator [Saprospiraceae bacterium]MBK7435402.1 winged helix-turn-helix transcriptional regulator [Saprospiraceae bacterium]MBK8282174.1 winged helix-turn-helix transcriptional regulator [Saprospiraceae bacterium]MBK8511007.1 winged helix-turn-helix transcriptional regulator [Saprospiraceae bacterium]
MRRDVFQAIADPVRRDIIDLLSKETLTVNEVAQHFDISRPAISKHLKILKECGIVNITKEGREQIYAIQSKSLVPAFVWMEPYQKIWEDKLDSFENYLNKLKNQTKKNE